MEVFVHTRNRFTRAGLLAAAFVVALLSASSALAQPVVVASGLDSPRHLSFAADGELYVAEAGRGGAGPCAPHPSLGVFCFGLSGAVTQVQDSGPDPRAQKAAKKPEGAVRISGVDDLLVRFAKCCSPVPGDGIVGFITRGRGLTVHARDCLTVVKNVLDKERFITVEWDGGAPTKRPVRIAVYIGQDRPGLLAEITGAISSRHGNITKAEVTVTEDRRGLNHFVVEVDDLRQLQEIMQAIREVRDVINVERIRNQ